VFLLNRPRIDVIYAESLTLVEGDWEGDWEGRVPRMRTVLKHMEGERGGGNGGWGVDDIREDMTLTRNAQEWEIGNFRGSSTCPGGILSLKFLSSEPNTEAFHHQQSVCILHCIVVVLDLRVLQ
jgi:hypothetical protein